MDELKISPTFNFNTIQEISFQIYALDNTDQSMPKIRFDVYTQSPEYGGILLFSGQTDDNGLFEFTRPLPTYMEEVTITTKHIGLVNEKVVAITGANIRCVFGGKNPNPGTHKATNALVPTDIPKVWVLGTFDGNGKPNYLEPVNDDVTTAQLADINATLPEYQSVPVHHPEFLASTVPSDLSLLELCDVYVTFISEGAGFKNSVGFFTYPTSTPPTSVSQIDTMKIIFPNSSFEGSGGNMHSGNKVKIGRFSAGTSIGWVIFANGWNGSKITAGSWTLYSIPALNFESDPNLKKHTILLRDPGRHSILFSFEDWRRDQSSCDQDFNDVVLYVKANPVEAINTDNIPQIVTTEPDQDGDGVPDNTDDYPNDPNKAFDNYYPSKDGYSSLAFEDLWPAKGDYDMNDLVLTYRFNQITNCKNKVVEIKAKLIPEAQGAGLHNGFAFQIPVSPAKVVNVTGLDLRHNLFPQSTNNTESGQSLTVIPVFDDAYDQLPHPGSGTGTNTTPGSPYVTPPVLNVDITFTEPISISIIGTPPYNPFIVVNQSRGTEVHLPNKPPTDKANTALFRTLDDTSDPPTGRYYKTINNLPWAINISDQFAYPIETAFITSAHLKFASWAESSGTIYKDWYKNLPGYRNNANIYTH